MRRPLSWSPQTRSGYFRQPLGSTSPRPVTVAQIDAALELLAAKLLHVDVGRRAVAAHRDFGRAAGRFAHRHACRHDADRAHRLVRRRDAPARDQQVADLLSARASDRGCRNSRHTRSACSRHRRGGGCRSDSSPPRWHRRNAGRQAHPPASSHIGRRCAASRGCRGRALSW